MDPVTLMVTALAPGGGLRLKDMASAAVKGGDQGLMALVKKRLAGRCDDEAPFPDALGAGS
jgi:hypothetical protein